MPGNNQKEKLSTVILMFLDSLITLFSFLAFFVIGMIILCTTGLVVLSFFNNGCARYWLLAPVLGISATLSLHSGLFLLGFNGSFILIIHLLLLFAGSLLNRRNIWNVRWIPLKRSLYSLFMTLFLFIVFSTLNIFHASLYPISNNGDAQAYCVLTDFLLRAAFPPAIPRDSGALIQIQQSCLATGFAFGFSAFQATMSLIMNLPPYMTFQASTHFVWALALGPLFWILSFHQADPDRRFYFRTFLLCLLLGTNSAILSQIGDAYAPAGLGLAISLACFALILETDSRPLSVKHWLLFGILLNALLAAYAPLFAYVVVLTTLWLSFHRQGPKSYAFLIGSIMVNPLSAIWFTRGFLLVAGFALARIGGEGWQFVPMGEWLGFHHYAFGSPWPQPAWYIVAMGLSLALMTHALYRIHSQLRLFFILLAILIGFIALYSRLSAHYPYMYYKNMLYFSPLGLCLVVYGVQWPRNAFGKALVSITTAAFLACYLFGNYQALVRFDQLFPGPAFHRIEAAEDLGCKIEELLPLGKQPGVHIANIGSTEGLWLAYFLRAANLRFDRFLPNFLYQDPIDFEFASQGYLLAHNNSLKDIWNGRLGKDPISFYRQVEDAPYIVIKNEDEWRYPLAKKIYSNSHYALLEQRPGWRHLNFHSSMVLTREPFPLSVSSSGIEIAGHHYPLTLQQGGTATLLIRFLGNLALESNQPGECRPSACLVQVPIAASPQRIELVPQGLLALSGALNVTDSVNVTFDDLAPIAPVSPPWPSLFPGRPMHLVEGAYALEGDGKGNHWRWTQGRLVAFTDPIGVDQVALSMRLSAFPYRPQSLRLLLNGEAVDTISLHANEVIDLSRDLTGLVKKDRANFFELQVSEVFAPDTFDHLGDIRKLGVCIHRFELQTQPLSIGAPHPADSPS